jgi:acyl carrier protein
MRLRASVIAMSLVLGCKSSVPRDESVATPRLTKDSSTRSASRPQPDATVATVQTVIAKVLGVTPADIPPSVVLSKLPKPADDLDVIEIVLALEEHFHIQIPDEAVARAAGGETSTAILRGLTADKLASIVKGLVK